MLHDAGASSASEEQEQERAREAGKGKSKGRESSTDWKGKRPQPFHAPGLVAPGLEEFYGVIKTLRSSTHYSNYSGFKGAGHCSGEYAAKGVQHVPCLRILGPFPPGLGSAASIH